MSKTCTKCGTIKPDEDFIKNHGKCRSCRRAYRDQYVALHSEEIKRKKRDYYSGNKKRLSQDQKAYRATRKDEIRLRDKTYREANKEAIKQKRSDRNPEKVRAWKRAEYRRNRHKYLARMTKRKKEDLAYRLHHNVSCFIRISLRQSKGGRAWEALVGWTLSDLKTHLEKHWLPGMNWDNYGFGSDKWHIDHCIPRSRFNYSSPDDPGFRECWRLNNLQPLWQRDNCSKQDRWSDPLLDTAQPLQE